MKTLASAITPAFAIARRSALLALAIAATTTAAHAESDTTAAPAGPAVYVGIGTGRTTFGYDTEQCQQDTGMSCDLQSTDTGMKIYLGAAITPNLSLEASLYDFGSLEGTVGGVATVTEDQAALSVAALGVLPFNEHFAGALKLGYFSATMDATANGPGGTVTLSDTARNFLVGAALQANLNAHVGVRVEIEHFVKAGDAESDIDLASASLRLVF